jgi:very-short-patch-repair endonuclease
MSRKRENPIPISISYPHVAAEWHPTHNCDLTPDKISAGVTRKVWWLCPRTCPEGCVHEWEALVGNRCKGGYGCPFCSRLTKRVCVHTSIATTHPEITAQWHPTRNESLRPEDFSHGSEKQVWWLCPRTCPEGCAHEWKADISKRILRGEDAGCPYCATNHKKVCYHSSLAYLRPDIAAEWDHEKNGELKPDVVSLHSGKNVWWKCSTPCEYGCKHEWQARINDRSTTSCPHCNRTHVCFHQSISFTHPEIVEEWHPTKNNGMDPTKISYGSSKRVWWNCRYNSDHEWITAISNRCSGGKSECPYCLNKTERKVFEYLTGMGVIVQRQFKIESCKRVNYLPFDLCIPEYNTIIEIDGAQHFKTIRNWMPHEETLQRDIFKMQQAEKEGYRVIRVFQELVFKESTEWMKANLYDEIISGAKTHKFIANDTILYDRHRELYNRGEVIELI